MVLPRVKYCVTESAKDRCRSLTGAEEKCQGGAKGYYRVRITAPRRLPKIDVRLSLVRRVDVRMERSGTTTCEGTVSWRALVIDMCFSMVRGVLFWTGRYGITVCEVRLPRRVRGTDVGLSMANWTETGVGAIRYYRCLRYGAIESAGTEAGLSMVRTRIT
jgi:hypothetical protein